MGWTSPSRSAWFLRRRTYPSDSSSPRRVLPDGTFSREPGSGSSEGEGLRPEARACLDRRYVMVAFRSLLQCCSAAAPSVRGKPISSMVFRSCCMVSAGGTPPSADLNKCDSAQLRSLSYFLSTSSHSTDVYLPSFMASRCFGELFSWGILTAGGPAAARCRVRSGTIFRRRLEVEDEGSAVPVVARTCQCSPRMDVSTTVLASSLSRFTSAAGEQHRLPVQRALRPTRGPHSQMKSDTSVLPSRWPWWHTCAQ
mmetsp:Transcript_65437/g.116472  ORF Transcript_65437/g.116472 Transcript_65437/m.116472 type:complete len:254 (-) Transcript_65437:827-1588(-)